jgi:hypothetical protein
MPPRGSGIVINIGANGTEAKEVLHMVQEQLRETGRVGKEEGLNVSESMEGMVGSFKGAFAAILPVAMIAEATEKIKEMIASSVELGMELGHATQETGISAQNMSVLKYASDVTGVSFEALTKGMGKMSKAMLAAEEGSKPAVESFNRLGISQQQVQEHSEDMLGMLGMVADRFQTLPDGPQKAAVAISLFGKAGMGLIPFLNQGSEGISRMAGEAQSLGLVLDEEGIAKLEGMHHAVEMMKGSIEGAELGITTGLAPAFETLGNAIASAMGRADGWIAIGETMGEVSLNIASSIGYTVKVVKQAIAEYDSLEAHINAIGDTIDSKIGFTAGQRDRASAALKKDIEESKKAEYSYHEAETEYFRLLTDLATPAAAQKEKGHETGGIILGDQSEGAGKSADGIAKAQAALASAQAEAIAKVIKDADDSALVANEAWHKLMLISDEEFYAEKLRLEEQSIDAQETAIKARQGELQTLLAKQQGDKLLKRDKGGQSAEELNTQKQLVELAGQLNAIEAKRQQLETNSSAETQLRANQEQLAVLKIAAQIEAETNTTITSRLALMRAENALAIQKAGADSPEAAQLQALEQVKEAKLQIGDIDRQIRESEADNKRATDALADHAAKDPRFKLAAAQQINKLNADEAAQLKVLVAQYDALAQTLGGPFLQTAKNLHAEMDKLNTPNKKQDADFTKTLGDGITHMAEQINSAARSGRDSFHQMAQSIEKDVIELAIKLAAQKWLMPMLNGLGSGGSGGGGGGLNFALQGLSGMGIPGFANGGDYSGDSPMMVGEHGPELAFPKGPGTIMPDPELFFPKQTSPASPVGALSELSSMRGGGAAPITNINLTNASSQPVTARQTGSSFDADTRSYMTHVILEDLSQGGPISSALRPGG